MAGNQQHIDLFPGGDYQEALPTTLNVITILTFIYSAFAFLSAFGSFLFAPYAYQASLVNQDRMQSLQQLPNFFKSLFGSDQVEAARLQFNNRVPILLITLAGVLLCFFGALQMRKLKKRGFTLYVAGDLLPLVIYIFLTHVSLIAGIGLAFTCGIALLFVILYANQLKYMK